MVTDFIVKYDPEKDSIMDLTMRIMYSIFYRRLQYNKPVIIFVSGDSGEGKSYAALKIQEVLLKLRGFNLSEYLDDINVYTPLQYPEKLKALLQDKRLKKINIICMHEAREIIKAKMWHSFLTQSVADINAQVRSVKRMALIIVSQFIRDIATDIRYTLNYYCKVERPMGGNHRARLYIHKMWKDDRDLEKPKLRKRKIRGWIVFPGNKWRRYAPKYLELTRPPRDICKRFDRNDMLSKKDIINAKIDKLIREMQIETEIGNPKIKAMVDHYAENPENLPRIGKRWRKQWRLNQDVEKLHDLTPSERKYFQKELNVKLSEMGVIEKKKEDITDDS